MSQLGGTMNRPPSGFNRPGSRSTSYGGNQSGPQAAQGASVNTNVEVTARPAVMREGMKGMNVGSRAGTSSGFGPGRQVIDRSYYIGLLRPKIAELTAEIERLKQQEDQINKNSAVLGQLQQKHRTLTDEIAAHKATMADVNFAVQKANVQDAESLSQEALQLRQANAEARRQVDKLFLTSKEVDSQTRVNQQALEQELRVLEQRIINEGQDFNLYRSTRDEGFLVSDAVLEQMHELRILSARQELLLQSLAQDADKKRGSSFLLEILKKRRERDAMTKECSMSVEQEKQLLIKQAKSNRDDIEVLERQLNEGRDTLQETKNQLQGVHADLKEYSSDNSSAFQELQDKDREMQEFMESFPVKEKEELAKIQVVEQQIVEVLERISRAHLLKQQMPADNTPKMLEQLSAELGEKETQLKNATVTHQRLEKELHERKEELSKVAHLDEKITSELQQHAQKMHEQKQDMVRYSDVDGLRQEIDLRRKNLSSRKLYLIRQRDCSKHQIHLLSANFESKKQKLNENEVHTTLTAQEQKMRLIWQSAFALDDFVRMKEKETQYNNVKADCMRMADECNNILRDPKRFDQPPGTVNFVAGK